jgi:hypothetical protein
MIFPADPLFSRVLRTYSPLSPTVTPNGEEEDEEEDEEEEEEGCPSWER